MERSPACTYVSAAGILAATTDPELFGEIELWRREEMVIQEALFRSADLRMH